MPDSVPRYQEGLHKEAIVIVGSDGRANFGRIARAGIPLARNYRVEHQGRGVLELHPIEMSEEKWVPVKGWSKEYEISDQGRVRDVVSGKIIIPRLLRPRSHNPHPAPSVRLRSSNGYGPESSPYVFRGVAGLALQSFGQNHPPGRGWIPGYRDDDPTNTRLENLYWKKMVENFS